jgi:hypothetical protein
MRKLLVTGESVFLQPIKKLVEKQKQRTLVMWTIECAEEVLPIFESKFPEDHRPREALEAAKAWASGEIKMPLAKKAAHASHKAATAAGDENPAARAAARAIGHVVGTIHVETHAMGFVFYAITAYIYMNNHENTEKVIAKKCDWLYYRLKYWEENIDQVERKWAPFLLKDTIPNKEAKVGLNKK